MSNNIKYWQEYGARKHPYYKNCKLVQPLLETDQQYLVKLNMNIPKDKGIHSTPSYTPKKFKKMFTRMLIAALLVTAKDIQCKMSINAKCTNGVSFLHGLLHSNENE